MKKALITGITGQGGSYLAELLLNKGYEVHGVVRRSSTFPTERIEHILDKLRLHYGDLSDPLCLHRIIEQSEPEEVYNLGAQSHVKVSFSCPEYTANVVGLGVLRILEAIRMVNPKIRYYQASSSEMFGKVAEIPQRETTPFHPRSPYGAAKVMGFHLAVNYREAYGIHASNGILFNHESSRRGETFVTRKITKAVARIKAGKQKELRLGNLDAQRDWGFAGDYMRAAWMMVQQPEPDDYVIATGRTATVREFCELAFRYADLDWRDYVVVDPAYYRPAEVDLLLGDSTKARNKLGWEPEVDLEGLVAMMVIHDMKEEGL